MQVRSAGLVFNPASGPRNPDDDLQVILNALQARDISVRVFESTGDPDGAARQALAAQPDVVLVAGGDGTVGGVAGAMAHQSVPLGILPGGTANALAMAIGVPRDLEKACDLVLAGELRWLDLARCNGRIMSLLAAIGFEAKVVKDVDDEAKQKWGALAYYVKGLAQLPQRELFEARIAADSERLELSAAAVTVANAAPPSSPLAQGFGEVVPDDGRLDITIAGPETMTQTVETLAELVRAMVTRQPVESDFLRAIRAVRVRVETDPPQPVVVDGEDIGATPVEVVCMPKALRVLAPPATVE
ncbi:MAG: YegS/Rv2252/BmrU family lipid kinase [Bryobacteraceae bacterium]|nr:YegS/Rv2252/BmrU family lipid kinase [Bryobacteraceae bacterium]